MGERVTTIEALNELEAFHFFEQLAAHLSWASGDDDSGFLESVDLILSASLSA